MKQKTTIGLAGLKPFSGNKGCEALTYSFLYLLNDIFKNDDVTIYFLMDFPFKAALKMKLGREYNKKFLKSHFSLKFKYLNYKVINNKLLWFQKVPKLDYVFDFTQGDSFTDLYGYDRFNKWTKVKEYFIYNKSKLIIGSQTIGPFSSKEARDRAKYVLEKSYKVFSRDINSYEYIKELSNDSVNPILTTDVAFLLPYQDFHIDSKRIKLGFNPSGLLWKDSHYLNECFDYKDFCISFVKKAIALGYEVHLIGHVISKEIKNADNDCVPIMELKKTFPQLIVSPFFETPMQAKGYIKEMDIFVGSRMHATIAALSCGVPVIPISYSRKFEGLFKTLNYDVGVNGLTASSNDALKYIYDELENIESLRQLALSCKKQIDYFNNIAIKEYSKVFYNN